MAKYKIIPSSRTIVQSPISIGHKAEKGVEAIEFDVTAWVETYGSGTLTVIMRRWGDAIPYPIALEIDENNKATWTLSDTDTAKAGMAYAQLSYIVGDEVVKKSDIYTFRVMDSLTGEGDPPEAYESWLEHLTHFAAEAMAEVLDIEGIVTDKTLTVDGGIADGKATGDALALKADKSTTYTKAEVDQMIEDVEVETDTTLSVSGAPADAKKTGDALSALEDAVTEETDKLKADLGENENEITDVFTDYEVGGVRSEDGVDNSIGKSVRLPLTNPDDIYHVHIANGYQAYLFSYGANGSYLGRTNLGKVGLDVNGAYLKALKENTTAVKITVYNLSMSDDFTISAFIATGSYIRIRYLDELKLTVFSNSDDISALKNNSALTYEDYHQGNVNMESGQTSGTTKSVRTEFMSPDDIAQLYIPNGYQAYLFSYDSTYDPTSNSSDGYLGRTSLGKVGVNKTGAELKAYKDNTDTIIITVYNLVMSDDFNVQMFLDTGAYISYYGSIGNKILALKTDIKSVEEKATEENTEVEQLVYNDMYYADGKIRRCYNPYKNGGSRLLIGQLHCHDEGWNQSETAPELYDTASHEETMQNYKLGGYHFVTLTNYSYFPLTHVDDADMPSDLTWLCDSAEVPFPTGEDEDGLREKIKHIVEFNIDSVSGWRDFVPLKDLPKTDKGNGEILSIAHPYWTNTYITPEALAKVKGRIRFVEVWDGLTEYHRERGDGAPNYVTYPSGKGSDYAFEKMLDMGLVTWALAISDVHSGLYTNGIFKRGCVKVFANNNNRLEILEGLCSGNFYASSNVDTSVSSVSFSDGVYSITTGSETATTKFLKENGEVLKTVTGNVAEYALDGTEKYVRAVVYFNTGNVDYANEPIYEKVWTQPIINIFNPDYDNYFD